MDKSKIKFDSNFSDLRKILNSLNLIPGSSKDVFDTLITKILSQLHKNHDFEKIDRILHSE